MGADMGARRLDVAAWFARMRVPGGRWTFHPPSGFFFVSNEELRCANSVETLGLPLNAPSPLSPPQSKAKPNVSPANPRPSVPVTPTASWITPHEFCLGDKPVPFPGSREDGLDEARQIHWQ
jgi:hypothetical protein